MSLDTLSETLCPKLDKWRNSVWVWGLGIVLNVMSFADVASNLLRFIRIWRGV